MPGKMHECVGREPTRIRSASDTVFDTMGTKEGGAYLERESGGNNFG